MFQQILYYLFFLLALHALINVIRINKISFKYRSSGLSKMPMIEKKKIRKYFRYILFAVIAYFIVVIISFNV
jgi:hypothetical protein